MILMGEKVHFEPLKTPMQDLFHMKSSFQIVILLWFQNRWKSHLRYVSCLCPWQTRRCERWRNCEFWAQPPCILAALNLILWLTISCSFFSVRGKSAKKKRGVWHASRSHENLFSSLAYYKPDRGFCTVNKRFASFPSSVLLRCSEIGGRGGRGRKIHKKVSMISITD